MQTTAKEVAVMRLAPLIPFPLRAKKRGLMVLSPDERAVALMKARGATIVVLWAEHQWDYFGTTAEFHVFTADPADLRLLKEGPFLLAPRRPLVGYGRKYSNGLIIAEHMTGGRRARAYEIGELCRQYLAAQRKSHSKSNRS